MENSSNHTDLKKSEVIARLGSGYVKFWSLKFLPLSASMLATYYITKMEEKIGVAFYRTVMICKGGNTTTYSNIEERRNFGLFQASKYVKNGNVKEFCEMLRNKTSKFLLMLKEINEKDNVDINDFRRIVSENEDYCGDYGSPRAMVDFSDPIIVQNIVEDLKDVRLYAEPIYGLINEIFGKFLNGISKESGYDFDTLSTITYSEVESYFNGHELPDKKVLEERKGGFAMVFTPDLTYLSTDNDEVEKLSRIDFFDSTDPSVDFVKGTTAFKGKVTGIARIVMNPFNVKEFNVGDVLITGMTRPDFLPIMKRSSAIVTDIGGLLCHAAIVAREIGIPCIIGTVKATKVFHDGDLVEVDATKGEVRILEKAK